MRQESSESEKAAREVDAAWEVILRDDRLRDIAVAAAADPRLRSLFPCKSHERLHFSRCIPPGREPPTNGIVRVNGEFAVVEWTIPDAREIRTFPRVEDAVAFLARSLPPDFGPAVLASPSRRD